MHKSFGSRTSTGQRLSLPFGLLPKTLNLHSTFSLRNSCFNMLPVIKEEDAFVNDENVDLENSFFQIPNKKNNKKKIKASNKNKFKKEDKTFESRIKLSPLVNINCMMNVNVKQSQPIWKTNFGMKLIKEKECEESKIWEKKTENKLNEVKRSKSKDEFGNLTEKIKNTKEEKSSFELKKINIPKRNKIKPKKFLPTNKFSLKRPSSLMKEQVNMNSQADMNSKYNIIEEPKERASNFQDTSLESLAVSSSENQNLLTNCVKSILERTSDGIQCEYCSEILSDVKMLSQHNKKHEEEKQECLICSKVYRSSDFIHHLLMHEGVDKYSCKKCKKYFPTAKKYNKHCNKFHFQPPGLLEPSQSDFLWIPKYECKRCNEVFDSEDAKISHRRSHVKTDLMGAYLLNSKHLLC